MFLKSFKFFSFKLIFFNVIILKIKFLIHKKKKFKNHPLSYSKNALKLFINTKQFRVPDMFILNTILYVSQ